MADLARDIRLAVDSGEVAIGAESVISSIKDSKSKLVILASLGKKELYDDITHLARLSEVKVMVFNGNSMELGTVCGKPFSVSALAVITPGNSGILTADYSKKEPEKEENGRKKGNKNVEGQAEESVETPADNEEEHVEAPEEKDEAEE